MAPFRNPFQKRAPPLNGNGDENLSPTNGKVKSDADSSLYSGSRASSAISIRQTKEDDIKLSVVNDSGVYLPPSPPDKKPFWNRTPTSTTTNSHRSMLSENEPFSISRESFESYRRSFDVSARTPVTHHETLSGRPSLDSRGGRQSLDARGRHSFDSRSPRLPRLSVNIQRDDVVDEETFEDVGLEEAKPKKRGIFARFAEPPEPADENSRPSSSHRGFHIPGRKRGQSGQGAELGNMPKPESAVAEQSPIR